MDYKPTLDMINKINKLLIDAPSYVIIAGEMGTMIIARRYNKNCDLEYFYMDSDSWYNETVVSEYKQFIESYTLIQI
jgi:hypothetical protein